MANAGGRLLGTLLSGLTYQIAGLTGCLLAASSMVAVSWLITLALPAIRRSGSIGASAKQPQ